MNILLGGADGYNWSQLRGWVLTSKCFSGRRVLLTYRMDDVTKKKCLDHGVEIVEVNHDIYGQPINHDARVSAGAARTVSHEMRYFHAWQFLEEQDDIEYVVLTDTRDVIFQKEPIEFIHWSSIGLWTRDNLEHKYILAPQEGILYKDEPWNADNLYRAYGGYVWEIMKDKPTYNCGTVAGRMPYFKNLMLEMWSMTTGKLAYPADQCSFGVLVEMTHSADILKFPHDDGWCCQCGVTADPTKIDAFRPHLITKEPMMDGDGYVCTSKGEKFCLVHQYERNPAWLGIINRRLNGYDI